MGIQVKIIFFIANFGLSLFANVILKSEVSKDLPQQKKLLSGKHSKSPNIGLPAG
jgi:hypothetical protein